jgi:hypothetical protein
VFGCSPQECRLGDIIKAYTKDVIRQTNDSTSTTQLLEFSYQCEATHTRMLICLILLILCQERSHGWVVQLLHATAL